jgi:rod shape-determining protein MreC
MPRFQGFVAKHRTGTSLAALTVVSILLLLFAGGHPAFRPKAIGLAVFSVFENGFTRTGSFFSRTVASVNELKKLRAKYNRVERQLSQFETVERDIVELRRENKILRKQLGFSRTLRFGHIPAEVIGKDPGNIFSTIVIDKGSRDGVKKDMPIVAFQDGFQGLVGKVVVVSPHSSIVQPIVDPNCYVAARLQNLRYEGLVSGLGSATEQVKMDYVQKRARDEIKYGDLVITSGMNSIYPKGIYIGRVRSIGAKEWQTSLELTLQPIVDFARIEYVFAVTQSGTASPSGVSSTRVAGPSSTGSASNAQPRKVAQ